MFYRQNALKNVYEMLQWSSKLESLSVKHDMVLYWSIVTCALRRAESEMVGGGAIDFLEHGSLYKTLVSSIRYRFQ
jgi:hypothetical protein